jgi:thiamine pyrophosphate-dependent acetolactate synthase large subunit-like protein
MTRINGRSAFLQLLVDEGVSHLFGNPGTTELPIMEVVPDFPQLKFVLGLQESVSGCARERCMWINSPSPHGGPAGGSASL